MVTISNYVDIWDDDDGTKIQCAEPYDQDQRSLPGWSISHHSPDREIFFDYQQIFESKAARM